MKTNITELAEFFPSGKSGTAKPEKVQGVAGWIKGEPIEVAIARNKEKAARIQAQKQKRGMA